MVEGGKLGGACLNVGCVPTKAILKCAQVYETVRRASEFGVRVSDVRLDFAAVMARQRGIVESWSGESRLETLREQEITLLEGHAAFEDAHTLRIGETPYRAARFVVATGSEAVIPDIPGLAETPYLTSDDALALEALPASVLIIGGGVVGCEFGSFFNAFGSEVTIVGSRLLSGEDDDVGAELADAFGRRGVHLALKARVAGVRLEGDRKVATLRYGDGRTEERAADALLVATGRRARYGGLKPGAAGVEIGERGVSVDGSMRTSAPHIWAAGDVTGRDMYTHSGDEMGEAAGWNAAGGSPPREASLAVIPRPVYSLPEVAAVGLTEREARELGCDIEVAKVRFSEITRSILNGETEGWCKLIAECSDGRILGAAIVGAEAGEHISEIAVAMQGGVSALTLGDTLHPYPTVSEAVRWTADQIGKWREDAHIETARRQPCSLARVELVRREGEDGEVAAPEDRLNAAAGWREGYGETDEWARGSAEVPG
jgi:pyruvate/2-oxoglutarate dehydrogenase complex dihydrolipoamide dehydrogenase (E3) component